jgi:endonuclease YncB( thermonuclease family)
VKILSHFSTKDSIYTHVPLLSRKSLNFIRKAYPRIEDNDTFRVQHANERIKFQSVKSIEEHNSGINQMIKLGERELVTVSDDCTLKFWNS